MTQAKTSSGNTSQKVLDILIVGGGPAGTATAFRALELGMRALVIDHDDLMKRIRDYSKDKLILPSFGGGDRMKFPKGGALIGALPFQPIDKDDMCKRWKDLYKEHHILHRTGVEFTELQERPNGVYRAICWNHQTRSPVAYAAKHVVIAIGHGVPRRFNIPGNTDGIAFHLDDAQKYVGRPACVIGGGTSAAEAVIAISNAKAKAEDKTEIYWSYRGDRLPRVSKALAEVFFEAYTGNGNIRYIPRSEPAAVVTAEDHEAYLAVRVDRRRIEGRPMETTHLEFPKAACIACIGQDVPESLLKGLGIHMVHGGPRNRKRMVVSPHLESRRPNVFLVGDLLSQAYFRTDDFDANPSGFEEVKHPGNIKSALRDGVFVAEVIRQRLDGKTNIQVAVVDAEEAEPSYDPVRPQTLPGVPLDSLRPKPEGPSARLFRVLPSGVVESEHPVAENTNTSIGRRNCDIVFSDDTMIADRHAIISHDTNGYHLHDESNAEGVFLRVPSASKFELKADDLVRAGRQFLLICSDGKRFWLNHYDERGNQVGQHRLGEKPVILGRDSPNITLDPKDMTLSRRHLAIAVRDGRVFIKDLNSANNTYVRVRERVKLNHGDQFQVGRELLTFSEQGDAVLDTGHFEPVVTAVQQPPIPADQGEAPRKVDAPALEPGTPSITFEGLGKTVAVAEGQTICEVAEAHGIKINAECHAGVCGSDPIRVISGREHLNEPGDQESETLEDLCDMEPGPCRLACMARVTGPVTIKIEVV